MPIYRTYYKYEIAAMYGVHWNTLRLWLKPHKEKLSVFFDDHKIVRPADLETIYAILGKP
jgi:hypothetical protein